MRRMSLDLGRRLTAVGVIDRPTDVFWLRRDELGDTAADLDDGGTHLTTLAASVERRKALWREQRRVTPPQLLPKGAWTRFSRG
jgi:hypothetical protein